MFHLLDQIILSLKMIDSNISSFNFLQVQYFVRVNLSFVLIGNSFSISSSFTAINLMNQFQLCLGATLRECCSNLLQSFQHHIDKDENLFKPNSRLLIHHYNTKISKLGVIIIITLSLLCGGGAPHFFLRVGSRIFSL